MNNVSPINLILLVAVYFLTSVVSVVTGSTSLITVPLMISLGIEAHTAVSTNMLALVFMSLGGVVPFVRKGVLRTDQLPVSLALTAIGSGLGAGLLLRVPERSLQITIAVAMVLVATFTLMNRKLGSEGAHVSSRVSRILSYCLVFLLAIYGGFFSGGYVTMLTAVFVVLSGLTFLEAIATTKAINFVSSGVATLIFLGRGTVDVKLGIILGVAMFFGALLGGRWAVKWDARWLRRVFIVAVLILAVVMITRTV